MPKYFMEMLVLLEEFFLRGLETKHLGIKKKKSLRPEDKFSAARDMPIVSWSQRGRDGI